MNKKLALVTGATGGIGRAIAARLSTKGIKVVVTDLPNSKIEEVAEVLGLDHIAADLGNKLSVNDLTKKLFQNHGKPSILVSAAGGVCGQTGGPISSVSEMNWRRILAANLDSLFFLSQKFGPVMASEGWGRIVTISSGAGLRPSLTGIQAYTAAKHGVVGLTKQLSVEFARRGVTVNSIAPGLILSNPTTEQQWRDYGPDGQKQLLSRIHTRKLGKPQDVAAAVDFLVSEDASWITGQVLLVDGGTN